MSYSFLLRFVACSYTLRSVLHELGLYRQLRELGYADVLQTSLVDRRTMCARTSTALVTTLPQAARAAVKKSQRRQVELSLRAFVLLGPTTVQLRMFTLATNQRPLTQPLTSIVVSQKEPDEELMLRFAHEVLDAYLVDAERKLKKKRIVVK